MKRLLSMAVVAMGVLALAGVGLAQGPGPGAGPMYGRMGGGWGPGFMGRGIGGPGAGGTCPMATEGGAAQAAPVTEDKARELAQQYADQHLKGFTVERVLPFSGMRGTTYAVELAGPEGQVRTFHVNPWGAVMPFGGPGRRAG